jgi:hypothetical protein
MSERLVAAFTGPVRSYIAPVTRALVLQGIDRASGAPLAVSFNEGQCAIGDAPLVDVEVFETAAAAGSSWRLHSGARDFAVQARAVQVHVDAQRSFFAAVPGLKSTLANRAGWALLLTLLRLPGGARLIHWLRSR